MSHIPEPKFRNIAAKPREADQLTKRLLLPNFATEQLRSEIVIAALNMM